MSSGSSFLIYGRAVCRPGDKPAWVEKRCTTAKDAERQVSSLKRLYPHVRWTIREKQAA